VCGPRERDPEDENTVTNPTLLVEVTSKSTDDRGEKLDHYKEIPTLLEYVIVSHRERAIEVGRRDERGGWTSTVARSGEHATLTSVPCTLDVDAIYEAAADPEA
jgi:Uma2 family endonuclease